MAYSPTEEPEKEQTFKWNKHTGNLITSHLQIYMYREIACDCQVKISTPSLERLIQLQCLKICLSEDLENPK